MHHIQQRKNIIHKDVHWKRSSSTSKYKSCEPLAPRQQIKLAQAGPRFHITVYKEDDSLFHDTLIEQCQLMITINTNTINCKSIQIYLAALYWSRLVRETMSSVSALGLRLRGRAEWSRGHVASPFRISSTMTILIYEYIRHRDYNLELTCAGFFTRVRNKKFAHAATKFVQGRTVEV